jgi:hypothetical protein
MRLPSIVLASFVGAYHLVSIRYGGRPIEALSKSLPDQSSWADVMSIDPAMDVFQQLPSLFSWDAVLQDLGVAFLIELPIDDGKGLSSTCEASGLYFVDGKHFMEKAVEVWCPPISLRVGLDHWVLVDFHNHEDVRS